MKRRVAIEAICGIAILASSGVAAYAVEGQCRSLKFQEQVEVAGGELKLSDLLAAGTCAPLRSMASHVSLGRGPRMGSVRVLSGDEIRTLVDVLLHRQEFPSGLPVEVPRRILVGRQAPVKSCAEITRDIVSSPSDNLPSGIPVEDFDCAAAGIPQGASLEVAKTKWEPLLERWQFTLRCQRSEDCLPFLVWARTKKPSNHPLGVDDGGGATLRTAGWLARSPAPFGSGDLIKRGQRALLRWEQGGIRVVVPVICLEGGGVGEWVRVRLGNKAQTMRAEVLGDGTLWVAGGGAKRE